MIAAEAREFAGVLRRLDDMERLRWPVQFAATASSKRHRWLFVADGPGPRLAREATAEALRRERVAAVLSTGFCGALDPALTPLALVAPAAVVDAGSRRRFETQPLKCAKLLAGGDLLCDDRVVQSSQEKANLRNATGAVAVDMESVGVAEAARNAGVPFHCLRVVTDAARETFGLDFNAVRDREGRFCRSRIAAAALRRPFQRLPELMALGRRSARAADRLGEFLVNCF